MDCSVVNTMCANKKVVRGTCKGQIWKVTFWRTKKISLKGTVQGDFDLYFFITVLKSVWAKQYILVIERTATPSVFQRCAHATSPCSVCSVDRVHQVVYSTYLTVWQSRQGEVAWAHLWKTLGDAVRSITNIYSLVQSQAQCSLEITLSQSERCLEQCRVRLRAVRNSAESSWVLSGKTMV